MAWSILSALVGVGSYLLARRARGSETQQNRSNLEDKIRERSRQLERSYNITLEALSDMLYLKNPGSKGHSKRVRAFTIAIARALGLSTEAIKIIARGALMHDIGMLGVPDAILNKSGHVTEREMEIIRKHCYWGYQTLMKIPFMQEAANIVYSHEERFDGTGYPRGLKGEEIPLGARIVAVAATFDAITSDHPGRQAESVQAARDEIDRCSGGQFDPKVVETFLNMPEGIWEDLRKGVDSPPS